MSEPLRMEQCSKDGFTWSHLPLKLNPATSVEDFRTKVMPLVRANWNPDKLRYDILVEGITNKLVAFHEDGKKEDTVILRIDGEGTNLFIDREAEILVMLALHREGLIPPIYCKLKNGMCYGFAIGRTLDEDDVRNDAMMMRISRMVAKLHAIEIPVTFQGRKPQIWNKLDEWLEIVPTEFDDPEKNDCFRQTIGSIEVVRREVERLKMETSKCQSPIVFSHNDLLVKNIIYNEQDDSISFIDFEYGGPNYLAFDIGDHFCEFAGIDNPDYGRYPDEAMQKKWIREYLKEKARLQGEDPEGVVTDEAIHALYRDVNKFALGAHLLWCLWALLQARYSAIDFNYIEYAGIRFAEYQRRKDEFYGL